jgi:hypothetical protein
VSVKNPTFTQPGPIPDSHGSLADLAVIAVADGEYLQAITRHPCEGKDLKNPSVNPRTTPFSTQK